MQSAVEGSVDATVAATAAASDAPEPGRPVFDAAPPPYRASSVPVVRRPVAHRPLALRDFGIWLAIVLAVDVGTWAGDGPVVGGFGLALVYGLVALSSVVGAGRLRRSPRLFLLGAMLGLLVLRMAILPADATNLAALAAIAALPLVVRSRQITPLELGAGLVAGICGVPSRIVAVLEGVRRLLAHVSLDRGKVLPVVIPLALAAIFIGIFALANPLVEGAVTFLLDALASIALPDPLRVMVWCAALGAGLLLLRPSPVLAVGAEHATAKEDPTELELNVARNTLAVLVLVFSGYLVLDAVHLVSGRPPVGVTTQHYAHQGAFWLTVALALLTGTIGVTFRGPLAHAPEARGVRRLAYAWTGLGLVLALATYARLAIHVLRSGLSDLRIVGVLGISVVVVGMLLTILKLRFGRSFLWLLRRQLDALAITLVVYALLPTHLLGAVVNVARIEAGSLGPLLHVAPQARQAESITVYLALLDHDDPRIREGVAAVLLRESARLDRRLAERTDWRQGDWVSREVARSLHDAEPALRAALADADPDQAAAVLAGLGERAALDWDERALETIAPAIRLAP